ncbi:hypothetical protein [Tessaracoccus sp. G1721]
MRNPIHLPATHGPEAFAVVHRRLLRELHEVRMGGPPQRDAAFDVFRRLLAASMAADRLCASLGLDGWPDAGRAPRFHVAVSTSVTILECVHRDSLDFVIEAGLLEEILVDATGQQPGPHLLGAPPEPESGWEDLGGAVQRVARELPGEDQLTFAQLRRAAEASVWLLADWDRAADRGLPGG